MKKHHKFMIFLLVLVSIFLIFLIFSYGKNHSEKYQCVPDSLIESDECDDYEKNSQNIGDDCSMWDSSTHCGHNASCQNGKCQCNGTHYSPDYLSCESGVNKRVPGCKWQKSCL